MKIRISTEIDVPNVVLVEGEEYASAVDHIEFAITQFITAQHHEQAIKWCAKAKIGIVNQLGSETPEYALYQYHKEQGKICGALKWTYEEIK